MKCVYCGEDNSRGCCYEDWADKADENWKVPLAVFTIGFIIFGGLLWLIR